MTAATATTEGIEEWVELVDQALQGLHHALNNRIGSLSALVELHQLGELPADNSSFDNLTADLTRLSDCNRMIRLLPRDSVAGEEPLILYDVLADVFAIHRYLHDARDLQVTVAADALRGTGSSGALGAGTRPHHAAARRQRVLQSRRGSRFAR